MKKQILIIVGSASHGSANEKLAEFIVNITDDFFQCRVFKELKSLPHFDPSLTTDGVPPEIVHIREEISRADGIIICTPEYIFSIPSGLKNLLEWCVSTTVFSEKALGIITASAHGQKGHEELKLIMKTLMTKFNEETTLLISGIRGKINDKDDFINPKLRLDLERFMDSLTSLLNNIDAAVKKE